MGVGQDVQHSRLRTGLLVDWLECNVFGRWTPRIAAELATGAAIADLVRNKPREIVVSESKTLLLGGQRFEVVGRSSAFPLWLKNESVFLQCRVEEDARNSSGEGSPVLKFQLHGEFLWRWPFQEAVRRFTEWCYTLFDSISFVRVARLDLAVDSVSKEPRLSWARRVSSRASVQSQEVAEVSFAGTAASVTDPVVPRVRGDSVESINIGTRGSKSMYLRFYDKIREESRREKPWLWEYYAALGWHKHSRDMGAEEVPGLVEAGVSIWRCEAEFRGGVLREFGLRDLSQFDDAALCRLWAWAVSRPDATGHGGFAKIVVEHGRRDRAEVVPLWRALWSVVPDVNRAERLERNNFSEAPPKLLSQAVGVIATAVACDRLKMGAVLDAHFREDDIWLRLFERFRGVWNGRNVHIRRAKLRKLFKGTVREFATGMRRIQPELTQAADRRWRFAESVPPSPLEQFEASGGECGAPF